MNKMIMISDYKFRIADLALRPIWNIEFKIWNYSAAGIGTKSPKSEEKCVDGLVVDSPMASLRFGTTAAQIKNASSNTQTPNLEFEI